MLIEKIIPPKSDAYENYKPYFIKIGDFIDKKGLIQLFILWTLVVSGIVIDMGIENRVVYWNWNNWVLGLSKIFLITVLSIFLLIPKRIWIIDSKKLSNYSILIATVISFFIILFGLLNTNLTLKHLFVTIPYIIFFTSGILIFQFQVRLDHESKKWVIENIDNKILILSTSSFLMILATLLGIYIDDPIISTVSMVSLPFPLIALIWPTHIRHLQRARFYPLFICAMFLSVRAPWFLIPLIILFYSLRLINYFRFGIVYPSFGVDFDEEEV